MNIQLVTCLVIFILMVIGYMQSKISRAVVALMAMAAMVLTGCLKANDALSGFSNPNTILMACMFIVSEGFSRTSAVVNMSKQVGRISRGSFTKVLLGYVVITMMLSQISGSSSAAFSIMFPLVFSMCDELGFTRSKMIFPIGLVSITTCATLPIGGSAATYAQYNGYLESFKITQYSVGFFDPMIARLPGLIAICLYAVFLAPKFCPELPPVEINPGMEKARKTREPLKPLQEKIGYLTFIFVIIGMLLADTINVPAWLITLIGALALTLFGVLSVKDVYSAASLGGIVMMYVGVLAVGTALTNTGAGEAVGNAVAMLLGDTHNNYVLGFAFFIAPFLLTQVMNNRAVSNIFIPVTIMTCSALNCNPVGPLMLTMAGALTAIMTPMATSTVNMFMGLGGYDQKTMLKMSVFPSVLLAVVNVFWIMTIYPSF